MATYTTTQSGHWTDPSTWTAGSGYPGHASNAGSDYAVINHAVAYDATDVTANGGPVTIGDGVGAAVLQISPSSGAGSLAITGVSLTVRGGITLGSSTNNGYIYALTINPSGSTGGGVIFDCNSGQTPVVSSGAFPIITVNGTSSGPCFIRTMSSAKGDGADSAGNNAYFTDAIISGGTGYWAATYCDFYKIGSSSQPAITASNVLHWKPFTFANCTIDTCGQFPDLTLPDTTGTETVRFTDCLWRDSAASYCMQVYAFHDIQPGGTRLFSGCVFLDRPQMSNPVGFTLQSCVFGDSIFATDTADLWVACDGCTFLRANDDNVEVVLPGPISNFLIYTNQIHTNYFFLVNSGHGSIAITDGIGEYAGTGTACLFGATEETSGTPTFTYSGVIAYGSSSGTWSPAIGISSGATGGGNNNLFSIAHNTLITNGVTPIQHGAAIGKADMVSLLAANLCKNTGGSTGVYLFATPPSGQTGYPAVLDEMPASVAKNNCWDGFDVLPTSPAYFQAGGGYGTAVTGDTNHEGGTVYGAPMSGSTAPGANDLTSTDPQFADDTRNLASWAVHKGYASSGDSDATKVAAAIAAIQADPSLTPTDLLPWVRAGYAPTNAALEASSYSGDPSTADAAGNAWPGAGPGIGAMGVTSSAATLYTLTAPSPAHGPVATASGNFTVTLNGPPTGTVVVTPHTTATGPHTFTPSSLSFSGATTTGTFTYSAVLIGPDTISTTNSGGLTDPSSVSYLSMVQTGSSGTAPSGIQGPSLGGFSFFTTGNWWQALGANVSGSGVSSQSATLIALLATYATGNLHVDFSTSTANGGDSLTGIPYNVVASSQSLLGVTLGVEASQSDPGPAPFFAAMSLENWYSDGVTPPTNAQIVASGSDSHGIVLVQNNSTGGVATLWEGWKVAYDSSPGWEAQQLSEFDLTTGYPRPLFYVGPDAAAMAISPLLLRYDEVDYAVNHGVPIGHPIRCTIPTGTSRNTFVWPARYTALEGPYAPDSGLGVPYGARLRLSTSSSWYTTHYSGLTATCKAIVDCLANFGMIVSDLADGIGVGLEGTSDQRWTTADISTLGNIPVSAFQILDTLSPPCTLTGPTRGPVGTPVTYTLAYTNTLDQNYQVGVDLYYSFNGGSNVVFYDNGDAIYSTAGLGTNRSISGSFTPASPGTYVISNSYYGQPWMRPPAITFRTGTGSNSRKWYPGLGRRTRTRAR